MGRKQQLHRELLDTGSHTIFQHSPISTQILSPNGMTLMVNKAWEELWKTNPQDIVGRYNILKDKQLIEKKIMNFVKKAFQGEIISLPAVKYEPDKTIPGLAKVSYLWVKAVMYPVKDTKGNVVYVVLQHEDITQQMELDKIISGSERKFRTLVEKGTDVIGLLNNQNRLDYITPSILQVLGYTPEEMKRMRNPFKLVHPLEIGRIMKLYISLLRNPGGEQRQVLRIKHKNGSYIWIDAVGTNYLHDKIINAVIINFRDITERKTQDEREKLLNDISNSLSSSIDYTTTIQTIEKLIIPSLADYSRIVLVDEHKKIQDIAVFHKEKKKIPLVEKLFESYKEKPRYDYGVLHILRTEKSEIMERVTQREVTKDGNNKRMQKTVDALGLKSYMGVPLKLRDKVIGAITFSSTRKDRIYTHADLHVAEEIARRIAYAVDNALLYKKAQERIEIEKQLTAVVTSSHDAIITKDLRSIITAWNKGAERMYGYAANEVIGKSTAILIPEEKIGDITMFNKQILQGKAIDSYMTKRIRKDGQIIDVSLTVSPLWDSHGKIIGTSAIAHDISQRLRVEHNLTFLSKTSKILSTSLDYRTTLGNVAKLAVPEMADWCSVDIKTERGIQQLAIAHVNPKKVAWAKELSKKVPPDPNSKTGVPNVLRTGKSEYYPVITDEMLVQSAKDEEQLDLLRKLQLSSIMIFPLIVEKETIGAITFVSAESRRYYTNEDLTIAEEVTRRASLAIENARLYTDSQKAVVIRDDFISLASHELKTPITSLKMYAQALSRQFEKKGDLSLHPYFQKMDQQTDKLARLVNDLLNVSKIQHGKLEFTMEEIDLNLVVKDTVDALQETTSHHRISIEGKIVSYVHADQYRIYQVLTNLLTNAIKYSPRADTIIVRLHSKKNTASVIVQDFGIGIELDQQKKIFNQFYRVTNPEEKTFPGLGMGLYISNQIIKRHGGTMTVDSRIGKGSRFGFTLPYYSRGESYTPLVK